MATFEEKDNILKQGKAIGGDGGSRFDDARDLGLTITGADRHRCVSVEVHWDRGNDKKLISICFNYGTINDISNHIGKHRGRERGKMESSDLNQDIFMLGTHDAIEKIRVYVGRRQRFLWDSRTSPIVTAIQFYTVRGDVSDLFGTTVDAEETIESFPGYIFAYAKGRAGLWVDKLQFVWLKTPPDRLISDDMAVF